MTQIIEEKALLCKKKPMTDSTFSTAELAQSLVGKKVSFYGMKYFSNVIQLKQTKIFTQNLLMMLILSRLTEQSRQVLKIIFI